MHSKSSDLHTVRSTIFQTHFFNQLKIIHVKMEIPSLLRAIMLYLSNATLENPVTHGISELPQASYFSSELIQTLPADQMNPNDVIGSLVMYDIDCAMPYPPNIIYENSEDAIQTTENPYVRATNDIPINFIATLRR